jgi:restriction system protein
MPIPSYDELMLPVLRQLAHGPRQIRDITNSLSDEFQLTAEERSQELPSGRGVTVIHSRVGWAKTYLKQAALVAQPRRAWIELTPRGREVLADPPAHLDSAYLRRYPEFLAFLTRSRGASDGETTEAAPLVTSGLEQSASPEERLSAAAKELVESLTLDLLERLRAMQPPQFEALMVDLLLKLGFGGGVASARGERIGRSGDGGVDGVMREDALGLDVVYIQAKRYGAGNAVGPEAIQAFAGSLLERGATKGVFATTSRFTDGAKRAAERLSTQRRIVLIDGDELAKLMIEHGVGVRTVKTVHVQRVDLSDYEDDD